LSKWRDLHCGEPRADSVGSRVTLAGWADTRRDHGGLVFIDLRDHTGICQLVINPENAPDAAAVAHEIRNEFVLRAEGEIVPRSPDAVNANLPTGEVELQVATLEILNRSTPLPFQLDEENVDENLRLRYRWLDLRRAVMQRNLRLTGTVVGAIRRRMEELGFVDLWTPSLIKGTPEGARDFLVPVRLQPGRFFALAQSPQVFKQLFMISGFDRYYQIATCWRDEDLRADRQFEFRQLDIEMAFAEREDVLYVLEEAVVASFEALDRTPPPRPFPRLSWHDVMARYGSDKPDLRFGLEIEDATELTRGSEFGVFAGAEAVRYLTVPKAFSRAELDRLEELAKEWGAKGLAYLVYDESGEVRSPIAKFLSAAELEHLEAEPGSTVLFAADTPQVAGRVLGGLRTHLGRELELADPAKDSFLWVIDFPVFEWDEANERFTFSHHPFTGYPPRGRGARRERSRRGDLDGVRPRLERVGARLRLDSDPRPGDPEADLPRARPLRPGARGEVRVPPRRAQDGRAAARRVCAGDRPFRRAPGRRAEHSRGRRVPEGFQRIRPAERRSDPDAGGDSARARNHAS
jgi:aspartyl-tRNA synthetase